MNRFTPPFDETVQLESMSVPFSDFDPPEDDRIPIIDADQLDKTNTEDIHVGDENRYQQTSTMPTSVTSRQNQLEFTRTKSYIMIVILFMANLINYMDRFTIAGVLPQIEKYYDVDKTLLGLLQTSFICTYMVTSPIFGYLGDRYVRKYLMAGGLLFWSLVTMAGSFIPKDYFWLFMVLRALVGVGEASYSTIAPTIIADLFTKGMRTRMLMVFYFAIPVGSGLGYIVGSNVANAFDSWQYGLRVTPFFGVLCVVLILIFVKEPPRGFAEGGTHIHKTSWGKDIQELIKNKSYLFSTFGVTCVAFVTGALAFWAPTFMLSAIKLQGPLTDTVRVEEAKIGLVFGGITCAAGFVGVALGTESARRYKRINPRADPIICSIGLLSCTPFMFFALIVAQYNIASTWILIFIGETLLCLNWAIVADILLYVVIPTRRSTAEAFQILTSHLLGDAGSPFLVGWIADSLQKGYGGKNTLTDFITLQYAMFTTTFVCVIGGGFFLVTILTVQMDKQRADSIIKYDTDSISDDASQAMEPVDAAADSNTMVTGVADPEPVHDPSVT